MLEYSRLNIKLQDLMKKIDYTNLESKESENHIKSIEEICSNKPVTTLFMLMSVDGKISTGVGDNLDFDSDFLQIIGVKEGLYQYYKIQETTDIWSMTSGKVMAKLGCNNKAYIEKIPVSFVVIDNKHLLSDGVKNLCSMLDRVIIVTTNKNHPAMKVDRKNLDILYCETLELNEVLKTLKERFSCERLTVQTGGTINSLFLRSGLLDYLNIVIAPVIVGGKDTPTLMDGVSINSVSDLNKLGVLELQDVNQLDNSYIQLIYKVIATEIIDNKTDWNETEYF